MAKTYAQLTQEIEALQEQAQAIREEEKPGVVARIKEAIAFYGLTAADLGFGNQPTVGNGSSAKPAAPRAVSQTKTAQKAARKASVVKYRDDSGHSWTGMGPMPGWLKAALAAGRSLEELAAGGEPAGATLKAAV